MRGRSRLEKGDIQPPEKLDILPTGIIFISIGKGCRSTIFNKNGNTYFFFYVQKLGTNHWPVVRYKPLASFHAAVSLQSLSYCATHFLYDLLSHSDETLLGRRWRSTDLPFAIVSRFLSRVWPQLSSSDMASLFCLHPIVILAWSSHDLHPSSQ
jgi:hypothetical protein